MEPPTSRDRVIRFGQFEADLTQVRLLYRGVPVRIENHPFLVLSALLERHGEVISRDELRHRLWPNGTYVDFEEGLNTAIKKLRFALHDSADNPRFIETVPRRGYRFIAPVTPQSTAFDGQSALPLDAREARERFVPAPVASPPLGPWRAYVRQGFVAAVLVLAGATLLAVWHGRSASLPTLQNLHFNQITDSGKVEDAAISPDGHYLAYLYGDGRGWDKIDGWEGGRSSLRLRQIATRSEVQILVKDEELFPGLTFSPDGNYIYFLRSSHDDQQVRDLYRIPTLGGDERMLIHDIDTAVAFSPDGRQIVYQRGRMSQHLIEVHTANADGSADQVLGSLTGGVIPMGCAWSPDGHLIAVSWFSPDSTPPFQIDIFSVGRSRLKTLFSSSNAIGHLRRSPDGSALLFMMEDSRRRGQLWSVTSPSGHAQQVTNDASNYDLSFDITPDAHALVLMQISLLSHLEVASSSDFSKTQPISAGDLPIFNVLPLEDGRIVTIRGGDRELWLMNADGSQLRSLGGIRDVAWPARCGLYLVFARHGAVTRVNLDGTNAKPLATGWSPVCSPDSQFVYYVGQASPRWKVRRVPIDGGDPVEVFANPGEAIPGILSISSDGKFLTFPFDTYTPSPVMRLAVVSVGGSSPPRFLRPHGSLDAGPRFSPDGKSLQYVIDRDGDTNLWDQPVSGAPSRQVTHFPSDKTFDYQWSLDGKQLFLCRGQVTADAVLIQDPK